MLLLAITSGIGIYGTTHEFKKDGKTTAPGKVAVVVLIISGLIAIALQFVEFNTEEQAAKAAKDELERSTARQQTTLEKTDQASETLKRVASDIDRGLHPITSISVSFIVDVPVNPSSARSAEYMNRVKRSAPRSIDQLPRYAKRKGVFNWEQYPSSNLLRSVTFTPNSELAPQSQEKFARAALGLQLIEFQFFREPIDPSKHAWMSGEERMDESDLSFYLFVGSDEEKHPHAWGIRYDLDSQRFQIEANIETDPKTWHATGKIVGIPDLKGTQMFVRIKNDQRLKDPVADSELRLAQKLTGIKEPMALYINGGRRCLIERMQWLGAEQGYPVYVFDFPKGEDFNLLVR